MLDTACTFERVVLADFWRCESGRVACGASMDTALQALRGQATARERCWRGLSRRSCTLLSMTAYHSFDGHVEASRAPRDTTLPFMPSSWNRRAMPQKTEEELIATGPGDVEMLVAENASLRDRLLRDWPTRRTRDDRPKGEWRTSVSSPLRISRERS
jgi:hypothetical protein